MMHVPAAGSANTEGTEGDLLAERMRRLTQRQRECLALVAQGYTSKEIGRRLGLSYSTVDNHLLAAVQTLGVEGRAEAGRLLREHEREAGQRLPRQPQPLAEAGRQPDDLAAITKGWRSIWLTTLLPPIGGRENDLSTPQRLFAIGRVAFFSVLLVTACVIVIRMCFAALT